MLTLSDQNLKAALITMLMANRQSRQDVRGISGRVPCQGHTEQKAWTGLKGDDHVWKQFQ